MNIPKEYMLEEDAAYNRHRFHAHLVGCLTVITFESIYESGSKLFTSFFRTMEEKEVAIDLLRWVMDSFDKQDRMIITNNLLDSLDEAGFFA